MTTAVDIDADTALAGVRAATAALREITARLAPEQVWSCTGAEVVELLRAQAELASVVEAAGLALVREADVRALAADAGQPSTRTWLARLLRITPALAGARIAEAEVACRQARDLGAALAEGRVNTEQARAHHAGRWARSRRSPPRVSSPPPNGNYSPRPGPTTRGTCAGWVSTSWPSWTRTGSRRKKTGPKPNGPSP